MQAAHTEKSSTELHYIYGHDWQVISQTLVRVPVSCVLMEFYIMHVYVVYGASSRHTIGIELVVRVRPPTSGMYM